MPRTQPEHVREETKSARFVAQFCEAESLWIVNGEMVAEVEWHDRLNGFVRQQRQAKVAKDPGPALGGRWDPS